MSIVQPPPCWVWSILHNRYGTSSTILGVVHPSKWWMWYILHHTGPLIFQQTHPFHYGTFFRYFSGSIAWHIVPNFLVLYITQLSFFSSCLHDRASLLVLAWDPCWTPMDEVDNFRIWWRRYCLKNLCCLETSDPDSGVYVRINNLQILGWTLDLPTPRSQSHPSDSYANIPALWVGAVSTRVQCTSVPSPPLCISTQGLPTSLLVSSSAKLCTFQCARTLPYNLDLLRSVQLPLMTWFP